MATQIALITGGCGDIGLASAQALSARGIEVALFDRIAPAEAAHRIDQKFTYFQCDVTDRAAVEMTLDKVWAKFARLDVCMCNAGIVIDRPFLDIGFAEWQRHLDVNLTGYFNVSQAVAQRWVKEKSPGKIIFTGSWVQDIPYKNIAAYCVSKAGVWMLARCAAMELAEHGITVNAVAPGIVDAGLSAQEMNENPAMREELSKLIPLKKMQTPRDVGAVVDFLASPASDYLTGTSILCDGGCTVGATMRG
jgi:NAD(P)-dependent dehydrogenase (short-subunit alcohol dehydrogenase family)